MTEPFQILEGDCRQVLKTLPARSIRTVITDSPYALGLNGKSWDKFEAVQFQIWCEKWAREVLRVMHPDGFFLNFGATRTYHRMACGVEDAGFEVQDMKAWLYGQGWPKHSSHLKPFIEPILVARPKGGRPVLNTDAGTIGTELRVNQPTGNKAGHGVALNASVRGMPVDAEAKSRIGRWPPNVAMDEEAVTGLPEGARRFVYVAKASTSEREEGLDDLPLVKAGTFGDDNRPRPIRMRRNTHPSVKPIKYIRYLVKLFAPLDSLVLDPFCGSGTTGIAATLEGRSFIGIELDPKNAEIARRRIAHWYAKKGANL